jgi:hypothetical protein
MRIMRCIAGAALVVFQLVPSMIAIAAVTPGDVITNENAAMVADLVSPGNFVLVEQGMRMTIVPTGRLDWPPPYKAATEKYSSQVTLNAKGELQKYVAGLPFPFIDVNDPQAANKIVWNFSYGPQTADFIHARTSRRRAIATWARQVHFFPRFCLRNFFIRPRPIWSSTTWSAEPNFRPSRPIPTR